MAQGVGDKFQQETKYHPNKLFGPGPDWAARPETLKEYPQAKSFKLPSPKAGARRFLDEVLRERRSVRDYSPKPVTIDQLSFLTWAADGVQREEHGCWFRTAPSAGALYPVETYLVANRVEDLAPGVYHYNVRAHALEMIRQGDFSSQVTLAALGQQMCGDAAVVFVWTAVFQRCRWKYGQRAYRYVYLDAGHIAQNLALAAVALGLGSCQIGALFDDEVNRIIEVDGIEESVLYMTCVGYPSR
ncbi:MAG: SagB/ThcOx family dehydrogenase [Armatimonadetes bacterium]|nr:SagB/ThcOx family dehydrogenase [Armatimonadota bacterium]